MKEKTVKSALLVFLLILAFIWILPIAWMVSTALKPENEIFTEEIHWMPREYTVENFIQTFRKTKILIWFLNSVIVTGTEIFFGLLTWSLAAFAFAKIKHRGSHLLFIIILSTMMIPEQVTIIPLYLLMSKLSWVNTYHGVVLPSLANAFGIFLLKQFFESVPNDLVDSAKIDGCGWFGVYRLIILPVSKPAIAALGIFTLFRSWNNFLWPIIMLQTSEMMTLPIGLKNIQSTYATESYGVLMAASLIASIPVLIFYFFFQRQIIRGISLTSGIKG
ncbi:MAG: carbohydrate ABC transporter permease [Spirochaetales bacterium]|nr:carbohydrate ABC transporter permease [Spirochaetales bacterium]